MHSENKRNVYLKCFCDVFNRNVYGEASSELSGSLKKKTVKRIALEIVTTKTKAMREIVSINYVNISRADCLTGHNMKDCSSLPSSKVSQGQLYIF